MKKHFLLTLVLLASVCVSTFAQSNVHVKFGNSSGQFYDTFAEAMTAACESSTDASPATITLYDNLDYTITSSFSYNDVMKKTNKIILNGQGHTLTLNKFLIVGGDLTIKNATLKFNGSLVTEGIRVSSGDVNDPASLALEDAMIDCSAQTGRAINIEGDCYLTIKGSRVISGSGQYGYAISAGSLSNNEYQKARLNITSCLLKGKVAAIYTESSGYTANDFLASGGMFVEGDAISNDEGFTSIDGDVTTLTSPTTEDDYYVASAIRPEASTLVNDVTKYYKSLNDAWETVRISGVSTVTLCNDIDLSKPLYINPGATANITLEGGNYTVTYRPDGEQHGGYESEDGLFQTITSSDASTASLNIAGGKYTTSEGNVIKWDGNAKLIISGGEFAARVYGYNLKSSNPSAITLKGGIFHYDSSYNSTNYGNICLEQGQNLASLLGEICAYYAYNEGTNTIGDPQKKEWYAGWYNLKTPVQVKACAHDGITGDGPCPYCGKVYLGSEVFVNFANVHTYGFQTLKAALEDDEVKKSGNPITIQLRGPVYMLEDEHYLISGGNVHIDLNGFGIYGNTDDESLLEVTENAKLTVEDNSGNTPGQIVNNGAAGLEISLASNGKLTVNSYISAPDVNAYNGATVNGNIGTLTAKEGELVLSDVTVANLAFDGGTAEITGGTYTQTTDPANAGNNLTVKGGTFSFDPENWLDDSYKAVKSAEEPYTWTVTGNIKFIVSVEGQERVSRCLTLKEANDVISASESKTINVKLIADYTTDDNDPAEISVDNNNIMTFNGNEKQLNIKSKLNINSGSLTIKEGSTINFTNRVEGIDSYSIGLYGGNLTVEGGTINGSSGYGALDIYGSDATLTITGGTLIGCSYYYNRTAFPITVHCVLNYDNVNISGGEFKNDGTDASSAIDFDGDGFVEQNSAALLLAPGYDFFTTSNAPVDANEKRINGKDVIVKQMQNFVTTANNYKYHVLSEAGVTPLTAELAGIEGTIAEETSITISETATDPYNNYNVYSVEGIGEKAFYNQTNIVEFKGAVDVLKSIGAQAFEGTSLAKTNDYKSIRVPKNLTSIGARAFANIPTMESVWYHAINAQDSEYSSADQSPFADNATTLKSVNISNNVTNIPDYMFCGLSAEGGDVYCTAIHAPAIGDNTFATTKDNYILKTPYAKDDSYSAWGFGNMEMLVLSDAKPDLKAGSYSAGNLKYNRSGLTVGKYASFAVPFDYDITTNCGLESAYQPIGISLLDEDGTLNVYFNEVETVEAGTPVLAKINSTDVLLESKYTTTLTAATAGSATDNAVYKKTGDGALVAFDANSHVAFGGTYVKLTNTEKPGLYVFNTNGSFSTNAYVNPFRAYITWTNSSSSSNNVKNRIINAIFGDVDDEDATAISMIMSEDGTFTPISGNIYDLNGRCVGTDAKALPRGTYIINGKKVMK